MEQQEVQSGDYLHTCLGLFAELTRIRYDRVQDLGRIERDVAGVRQGHQLTYDDIERIRNSEVWDADVFGHWPPRDEIEALLQSKEWDFRNLPQYESSAIKSLFEVFRQIEPVSVILRFVLPEHYGIFSPPVEKVLGIGPYRRLPDKYRAYSKNLRALRDARGFRTAADVDMALWVLQVGVLGGLLKTHLSRQEYNALKGEFEQDARLREIRVGNLTRQIFKDMSRTELAEAVLATDVELAGQIAGIEYERFTRRLVGAKPGDRDGLWGMVEKLPDRQLRRMFEALPSSARPSYMEPRVYFREAIFTRNQAIHTDQAPPREKVERLIEAMKVAEREAMRGEP